MRIGSLRFLFALVIALTVPACLLGELLRAGSEFQVNTRTALTQNYPAVALDSDGDFVVAWGSYPQDGAFRGVFARRFSPSGVALATEFQVNTYTTQNQTYPAVSIGANGGFMVVWGSTLQDGNGTGVFGQRFDSGGAALATEFQVNTYTLGNQSSGNSSGNGGPVISSDNSGRYVVLWHSFGQDGNGNGVFGRRLDAAGTPLAEEFQVNTYTSNSQAYPAIDLDADGDFVVTWHSVLQDGANQGVFARQFSSSGTALAAEFQVNVRTLYSQKYPTVGLDSGGDFVITWQSYNQDGANDGIFARRFASNGSSLGFAFQVNSYTTGTQRFPRVVGDADGDFVIAWQSLEQDGSNAGVFAQRFNSLGNRLEVEFQVNSFTTFSQSGTYPSATEHAPPAMGGNATGDFVVAWHSYSQDGGQGGIFAQRFDNVAVLDIDANGATSALTDGVLALRFLFGFTGTTLTAGVVDLANCQRCDATAIQAYLQTLI